MKTVVYSINGKYFLDFGIYISESKGLLDKLKPKPRKSYSWAEQHGIVVDLSKPKYEEREISLKGWIIGESWHDMKAKFDLFLSEFDKGGLARLLIEFGKELVYDVYLADGVELDKEFRDGKMYGLFTIKLKEPNPVKKVLKLAGNDLQLSFTSPDWIDINIDGINESRKDSITINKTLQNRAVGGLDLGGRNLFLSPKILSGYVVEANTSIPLVEGEEYVVSFDIKGQNNGHLFLNNSIAFSDIPINPNPNEWFRISKVFTFRKNDYLGKEILPHIYGATDVRNAKLEKGNKATDWTPAPEDVEAQITTAQNVANQALGLTQAQTANITALQQKTNFLSSTAISGNAIATGTLMVGNGLGANAGITGLGGFSDAFIWGGADYNNKHKAPISLHRDGFLRVRNAQGRVIFEIGQQNGDAVFNIYNNDGVKVAGIGERGIEFTGYIPESFNEKELLRLGLVNFNDNKSLISAINTVYGTHKNGFEGINGETYYRISFSTNTTGYSYNAGRNFESAGNLQYEQYFFASKNKFGDKVANGIYALKSFAFASDEANGGMYELPVTIYDVQEGKIIRSKVVNKTGYVNNVIIN